MKPTIRHALFIVLSPLTAYLIAVGVAWACGVDPFRSLIGMIASQVLAVVIICFGILGIAHILRVR